MAGNPEDSADGFFPFGSGALAADFFDGCFHRTLKLFVADDGGIPLRQRLAFAAGDFEERIAGHAELPFDDRGGVRSDEAEEVAANKDQFVQGPLKSYPARCRSPKGVFFGV
jgi:hypothetical protein